jgi:predicted dehydrogenase
MAGERIPMDFRGSVQFPQKERMTTGVAIVGCGLIGRKRARTLADARLVACADTVAARAESLAAELRGSNAVGDHGSLAEFGA